MRLLPFAMMHDGMMGGMAIAWVLGIGVLVLAIAALIKYLRA